MRIRFLQHVPFEGPGSIASWASKRNHQWAATRVFAGEPLPAAGALDWLVVMGGPMGARDEALHPWMTAEKRCIEAAIRQGKNVLGICLGAQLIADVLGAGVHRNPHREIGWFPVTLRPDAVKSVPFAGLPRRFLPFHWHGDTFELPAGAARVAGSEACRNQAFQYGPGVIGLQFHLETTPRSAADLVEHCGDELAAESPWVQAAPEMLGDPGRFAAANALMETLLDGWAGDAENPPAHRAHEGAH